MSKDTPTKPSLVGKGRAPKRDPKAVAAAQRALGAIGETPEAKPQAQTPPAPKPAPKAD